MGRKPPKQPVHGASIWQRSDDPPHAKWKVTYTDPQTGKPRTIAVSEDWDTTVEKARQIVRRNERIRLGLAQPAEERWAEEDAKPLAQHLDDWHRSMEATGVDVKHRRQFHRYATWIFFGNTEEQSRHRKLGRQEQRGGGAGRKRGELRSRPPVELQGLGISRVSQIVASMVQLQIGSVKAARSAATANRYLDAVNAFLNWGVGDERWERNVCQHLQKYNVDEDRSFVRRVVELERFRALLDETAAGPIDEGLTGAERSLLYWFTVVTGLRRSEVRGVRVCDLSLGENPGVWTRANISRKNKKRRFIPLGPNLAAALAVTVGGLAPEDLAIKCPPNTARMLRADLERAGIPYETPDGRFDFHGIRHMCGALLASARLNPKAVQEHLRHSKIDLTFGTYGHLFDSDRAETRRALPDFTRPGLVTPKDPVIPAQALRKTEGSEVSPMDTTVTDSGALNRIQQIGVRFPVAPFNPTAVSAEKSQFPNNPERHSATQNDTQNRVGAAPGAARFYRWGGRMKVRVPRAIRTQRTEQTRRLVAELLKH